MLPHHGVLADNGVEIIKCSHVTANVTVEIRKEREIIDE